MDLFKYGTRRMLRDIESELRFTRGLIGKDALDARVMAAMARVPPERGSYRATCVHWPSATAPTPFPQPAKKYTPPSPKEDTFFDSKVLS